jgi:hypothetical protein
MDHNCLNSLSETTHFCYYLTITGINLPGESGQLGINEDLFFRFGVKEDRLLLRAVTQCTYPWYAKGLIVWNSLQLVACIQYYITPHVMLCYVIFCHVMSCHVMSCHVMSCYVMSCHVMLCYVMSCHVMSCYVMSCHVMSCHVMSCHVMLCHVMSCHVMSY